jgi:methyl-accepting chemotaxis protein
MLKTIKQKMVFSLVIGTLIGSIGIIYLVNNSFKSLGNSQAEKTLMMLSESIFQTLRMGMNTGESAVVEDVLHKAKKIDGVKNLQLYRTQKVNEAFGQNRSTKMPSIAQEAYNTKSSKVLETDTNTHTVRLLKPLIAEDLCLTCHFNSQKNEVLGVMDLTFDLDQVDDEINSYVKTLITFIIVASVGSVVLLLFFMKKVLFDRLNSFGKAIKQLQSNDNSESIQGIKCTDDDEIGSLGILFNEYINQINEGLAKDKIVINEVSDVVQKALNGFYVYDVKSTASSALLEELKNNFNKMIKETQVKLDDIITGLIEFANSNYTYQLKSKDSAGNIGSLVASMDALSTSISEIISMIANTSDALASHINTLQNSSTTLANGSNQQASSLEETAASITEMTENIRSTKDKTLEMSKIADEAMQASNNGDKLANDTAKAMEDINNATTAITEAISVIDQIAFQTNILSLNAAVEAATAGEAGKGFAVVAGEVRSLAARSSEAANEIKELVEKAQSVSQSGKEITNNMREGFDVLNVKIKQTTELVSDVAEATSEQMSSIEQINDTINDIDNMTQENAQIAAEVKNMTQEISKMTDNLAKATQNTQYLESTRDQVCDVDLVFDSAKLKTGHIRFKQENYKKLGDSKKWIVVTENECALGKWISTHQSHDFAKTQAWSRMLEVHKDVHGGVQEYINADANGANNNELHTKAQKIEKDTLEIFKCIDDLKVDKCTSKNSNKRATNSNRVETKTTQKSTNTNTTHKKVERPTTKVAQTKNIAQTQSSDSEWDTF